MSDVAENSVDYTCVCSHSHLDHAPRLVPGAETDSEAFFTECEICDCDGFMQEGEV